MAKPVKSNRSFKFGIESKNSEGDLLNLNSLGNLQKQKINKEKEKRSRAGSQNNSFRAQQSVFLLGCK